MAQYHPVIGEDAAPDHRVALHPQHERAGFVTGDDECGVEVNALVEVLLSGAWETRRHTTGKRRQPDLGFQRDGTGIDRRGGLAIGVEVATTAPTWDRGTRMGWVGSPKAPEPGLRPAPSRAPPWSAEDMRMILGPYAEIKRSTPRLTT